MAQKISGEKRSGNAPKPGSPLSGGGRRPYRSTNPSRVWLHRSPDSSQWPPPTQSLFRRLVRLAAFGGLQRTDPRVHEKYLRPVANDIACDEGRVELGPRILVTEASAAEDPGLRIVRVTHVSEERYRLLR